jgi:hypothetical protein
MKKNMYFVAGKLIMLSLVIGMAATLGRVLHIELDKPHRDAFAHWFFTLFFFGCVLFLIFIAFYVAHLIATRDYKYHSKKK